MRRLIRSTVVTVPWKVTVRTCSAALYSAMTAREYSLQFLLTQHRRLFGVLKNLHHHNLSMGVPKVTEWVVEYRNSIYWGVPLFSIILPAEDVFGSTLGTGHF